MEREVGGRDGEGSKRDVEREEEGYKSRVT